MLPKKLRIKRELYKELLSGSRFVHSTHFSLRFKGIKSGNSLVGVSVSKKVAKSAVARNTTRRRVYSAVALQIKNQQGYLLLFVAKKGAETLRGEKLETEIKQLFSELK